MPDLSFIHNISSEEIELKYQEYLSGKIPDDSPWSLFFNGFELARSGTNHSNLQISSDSDSTKEFRVLELIQSYRKRGHFFTETNPVRKRRKYSPDLSIENFNLSEEDLDLTFTAGNELGIGNAKLSDIIEFLRETYCRSVGVEYMYIRFPNIVNWLTEKMESVKNHPPFSAEQKKELLKVLSEAVFFEKFLHKKFPGQKRFSLEGAENFIVASEVLIQHAAGYGVEEFVFGMAHRGRLNFLHNIMQKPAAQIFAEFVGKEYDELNVMGDVKYHLGFSSTRSLGENRNIILTLCPNPSHLEAVGPVVTGIARAKADNEWKSDYNRVVPVIVHGDASLSGQGVNYELIQMSELAAHKVGGTIHIVINNQIGFTTDYLDGRSSVYCTDVAKIIQSPIFHVNGDDPEAVSYVMRLAVDYRMKFNKDVFIDLLCYRKYGHNESDEPRYTQPELYQIIEKHDDPFKLYGEKLKSQQFIQDADLKLLESAVFQKLEKELQISSNLEKLHIDSFLPGVWDKFIGGDEESVYLEHDTRINYDVFVEIGRKLSQLPKGMKVYRKIEKIFHDRMNMLEKDSIDWGFAEQLAFGTLLNENTTVRMSGQDVERGTFSQRHSFFYNEETGEKYFPLKHIRKGQADFNIFNSLLSEYAVLGFEYGYALCSPDSLILWEAQFGDFVNGAQIVIDQFIASSGEKWNIMNNLVVLLPHGYEGQGPEHSSARMERFLSLCAAYNMDIVQCSTPANYFHLIRRQMKRNLRKPLICFTPKSLLRHPNCLSSVEDFTEGSFKLCIDDEEANNEMVTKIVLCSGKIFYDLKNEQHKRKAEHIALIRLEQLYPFPQKEIEKVLETYPKTDDLIWAQEEPANMGAWPSLSRWLRGMSFRLIARPFSSSPAAGTFVLHTMRQQKILDKVFGDCQCNRLKEECKMICLGDITEV